MAAMSDHPIGVRIETFLSCLILLTSQSLVADVVFDGTIGSNAFGNTRSGAFEIAENDGEIVGNNLFHSFDRFSIAPGESASFSHDDAAIANIISRVSGSTSTSINGALNVVFLNAGNPVLSTASFWLLNPNGIVIGDGASFNSAGSLNLSTANRLGFENGDDFYSHELTISSTLSIAEPSSFGFLDKQELPLAINPVGISVVVADTANSNTPIFLGNLNLIGTSTDANIPGINIIGDVSDNFLADPTALGNSSRFQALSLDLIALGVAVDGAGSSFSLQAPISETSNTTLSDIVLLDSNILLSDNMQAAESTFSLTAQNILIANSQVEAFPLAVPTEVMLRATNNLDLLFSNIRTLATGATDAGSIVVDAMDYRQLGGFLGSEALTGFTTGQLGRPGNIIVGSSESIRQQTFELIDGEISSFSGGASSAGDIIIQAQQSISVVGQQTGMPVFKNIISTNSAGGGNSGNLILSGDSISTDFVGLSSVGLNAGIERPIIGLLAGTGGISLGHSSIQGTATFDGAGADVLLDSGGNIEINSIEQRNSIQSGTLGDTDGGTVVIDAVGNLSIMGSHDIGSLSLGDASARGAAGQIFLHGTNVLLDATEGVPLLVGGANAQISSATLTSGSGADIIISSDENLTINGGYAVSSNSSSGSSGNAGILSLVGANIIIDGQDSMSSLENTATYSSSTEGSGNAGTIQVLASGSLDIRNGVNFDTTSFAEGRAGTLDLIAKDISVRDAQLATITLSDDSSDTRASLTVRALDSLLIQSSILRATTAGQAPGGDIALTSAGTLRFEDSSIQSATQQDGLAGNVNIFAGTEAIVEGAAEILTNSTGPADGGEISLEAQTLIVRNGVAIEAAAEGAGDAGNIRFLSDILNLDQSRVVTSATNGGGGDINFFADESIRLNSTLLFAASESSSLNGDGGSITLGELTSPVSNVVIGQSFLIANANTGNGGRINISADAFLRDASSAFQVTSVSGAPGSLEINAPEQDISAAVTDLEVNVLDVSSLIQQRCSAREPSSTRSSLTVEGRSAIHAVPDGYTPSSPGEFNDSTLFSAGIFRAVQLAATSCR